MIRPGVKWVWWVVLAGAAVSASIAVGASATASEIAISMSGVGTALIDVPALIMTGTLAAQVEQTGSVSVSTHLVDFVASGECRGTGYRDFVTGTTEVWVAYGTLGTTSSGQTIALRGLLHLLLHTTAPLLTEEVLMGMHYVAVTVDGVDARFLGEFAGSIASGDLAPPQAGAFVTLAGNGLVALSGETVPKELPVSLLIPLDSSRWAAPFADYLDTLFDGAL